MCVSLTELGYLKILSDSDKFGKKHCVRLLHHFIHRSHLCLVFEPLAMDLRKLIRKFGSVGLSLSAVQSYSHQLFIALRHLKRCGILHGDLKPDNLLVNEIPHNIVKVCDFGSATLLSECELTPYLVSRFYRAPEVMLGMQYNEQVDLWSVGCVLYELYTGKILFDGKNNNEMLYKIQEIKGKIHHKMLKKCQFALSHFNNTGNAFLLQKIDPATGATYAQSIEISAPTKDLFLLLKGHAGKLHNQQETKALRQLADLINLCLTVDPSKRPSVETLLNHPFITEKLENKKVNQVKT